MRKVKRIKHCSLFTAHYSVNEFKGGYNMDEQDCNYCPLKGYCICNKDEENETSLASSLPCCPFKNLSSEDMVLIIPISLN